MNTEVCTSPRSSTSYTVARCVVLLDITESAGTFAAFTATTSNPGNSIASGTVVIGQHAGSATLYSTATNAANRGPGSAVVQCLRVTYTGNLASSVRMHLSSGAVTNGTALNLKVERAVGGTGLSVLNSTMDCTNFGAGGTISDAYATAALSSFPQTYAASSVTGKAAGAAWAQNDCVDYRFTIVPVDDATPNAHSSVVTASTHTFVWEAQNN